MRPKINTQSELNFQPSDLEITREYYRKYKAISRILDENPAMLDAIHADLTEALEADGAENGCGGEFKCTSDTVLRILLCQIIEGLSLRQIIIRVDDSNYLRVFARVFNGAMIDFTTFCTLKNYIKPETWKDVNELLARAAVDAGLIDGERLRLDTTAVETNIHWPTDSSLLWDAYRTLARHIEQVREIEPAAVGDRRLLTRKAKKLQQKIARTASKSAAAREMLETLYTKLIRLVEGIVDWSADVAGSFTRRRSRTKRRSSVCSSRTPNCSYAGSPGSRLSSDT